MKDFAALRKLALDFVRKNRTASRHEFARITGLTDKYFYQARSALGITGNQTLTKTKRISSYLKRHPAVSNPELMNLFDCGKSTCVDARGIVGIYYGNTGKIIDLPVNELVDLRKYGLTYREIGEIYGVNLVTVRNRIMPVLGDSSADFTLGQNKNIILETRGDKGYAPQSMEIDPGNYNKYLQMAWV